MKYNILLIEDDDISAMLIKNFLEESNFKIEIANTVTTAISNMKFERYSLILLDISLPDFDGFEVLKYINRNNTNIPVIIISALSDKNSKLEAFKLGANDYMVKPIIIEELEARIWVQLKNISNFMEKINDNKTFQLKNNSIIFGKESLKLTKIEYKILKYLIENKNSVVQREHLLKFLSSNSLSDRSLDYHIKNIRIKIEEDRANPKYLITDYGVGYRMIC